MGRVGPQPFHLPPNLSHQKTAYVTYFHGASPQQEYLLEFTSEYGISEDLHPELPGPEERIVDFPEGKVGVYTKFFEFANFRLPLSQFLFDILGHYQIHLSQLSVIGAAKVSHFEINCHVLNIVLTLNLFCVFYIPSFNSGWMSFSKEPRKNTPQCYTKPLDSLKNWNNRFFWVDERVFPTVADWRVSASKDEMPAEDTYSPETVAVNVGTRPRAAHEVSLLTVIASRVIEMEYPAAATDSSGIPSTIERSPLDFANENPSQQSTGDDGTEGQEIGLVEEISAMGPRVIKERRKRGNYGVDTNAPPKKTPADVSDPDPLSFANLQSIPKENIAQSFKGAAVAGDPESENTGSLDSTSF
nr:hypothetical protein [Tanacetum cinerariifolium]